MLSSVKIKQVSCGDSHTLLLSEANDLFSFGSGSVWFLLSSILHKKTLTHIHIAQGGKLGHPEDENKQLPCKIKGLEDFGPIASVAAGARFMPRPSLKSCPPNLRLNN